MYKSFHYCNFSVTNSGYYMFIQIDSFLAGVISQIINFGKNTN